MRITQFFHADETSEHLCQGLKEWQKNIILIYKYNYNFVTDSDVLFQHCKFMVFYISLYKVHRRNSKNVELFNEATSNFDSGCEQTTFV